MSLRTYERRVGGGYAFPDNAGFAVNLPQRRSFSPDAAFFTGPLQGDSSLMSPRFLPLKSEVSMITAHRPSE